MSLFSRIFESDETRGDKNQPDPQAPIIPTWTGSDEGYPAYYSGLKDRLKAAQVERKMNPGR